DALDPGTLELTVGAWGGDCAELDVDLLVAFGARVTLDEAGDTNAGWEAERRGAGGESPGINASSTPPLEHGRCFIPRVNRSSEAAPFHVGARAWTTPSEVVVSGKPARGVAPAPPGGQNVGLLHTVQYRFEVFPGAEKASFVLSGSDDVD